MLKRLNLENIPEDLQGLVQALDPLPHRKWIRIANRWEGFLIKGADPSIALFKAIFEECFPKAEVFIRNFPMIWDEHFLRFYKDPPEAWQEIRDRVVDIIENDKTYFEFPRQNFDRLIDELSKGQKVV